MKFPLSRLEIIGSLGFESGGFRVNTMEKIIMTQRLENDYPELQVMRLLSENNLMFFGVGYIDNNRVMFQAFIDEEDVLVAHFFHER